MMVDILAEKVVTFMADMTNTPLCVVALRKKTKLKSMEAYCGHNA